MKRTRLAFANDWATDDLEGGTDTTVNSGSYSQQRAAYLPYAVHSCLMMTPDGHRQTRSKAVIGISVSGTTEGQTTDLRNANKVKLLPCELEFTSYTCLHTKQTSYNFFECTLGVEGESSIRVGLLNGGRAHAKAHSISRPTSEGNTAKK